MAEKTSVENAAEDDGRNDENTLSATNPAETSGETADDAADETGQIRERIEETRNRLGDTINAIQDKLSFSNISEQVTEQVTEQVSNIYETAKETVYDATVKKAEKFISKFSRELQRSNVIDKLSDNPIPVLLVTIGAGLVFFPGKKKSRYNRDYKISQNRSQYRNGESGAANKSVTDGAKKTLTGAAGAAYESAESAASSAYHAVSDAAGGTMKTLGNIKSQAKDKYGNYMEEKPLVIGAVAFVVGAAIGLAFPSTEYENEIVGRAREDLISKVKDSVGETVDKVKNIAEQAKNTVGEEAKNQGLV